LRWRSGHPSGNEACAIADKPTKSAYMWRDIERRAAMYGLQARLPAPYPAKQSVIANLIATVGMREGWGCALPMLPQDQTSTGLAKPEANDSTATPARPPDTLVPERRPCATFGAAP
jgi:hypothetical protein